MGFTLLDGPVVSTVGCSSGVPGNKRPIQANCSGPGSFFSSCRALWCCSQKKPDETGQVYEAAGSQGLILSSLQILNSCNKYFSINCKLMLCQSMNSILESLFE